MKRLTLSFFLCLIAAPAALLAQSDDTKAILDALKGLGDRMDGMQRQIDELKGGAPAPAPSASEPAKSPPAESPGPAARGTPAGGTPPGMKLVPGWVVQVIPYEEGNPSPDALFQFTAPKLPLKFNAHLATKTTDNWVRYRGEAKLNVFEAGRHVFLFDVINAKSFPPLHCDLEIAINGKKVIATPEKDVIEIKGNNTKTLSGGIDVAVGNYDITFEAGCQSGGALFIRRGSNSYHERDAWLTSSFNIQVRGPTDSVPRAFEPTELFHYVRQRASAPEPRGATDRAAAGDPVETASTEPPRLVRTTGVRTIVSEVNVRSKPSTSASLATRLEPGMQVRLVARTSDEEWHQVAVGDRVVGFVKTTALAANSR